MLQNLVVRRRDGEVEVRHRAHGAADVVGRHQQVIGVGPSGETLHREEAPEVRQVHLHDIDAPALDELADVGHGVRALAGGDREPGGLAHAAQRGRVLRRHRLFEPFRLARLQAHRHCGRRRGREAPVHLDHDLDVRADGLADGGHDLHGGPTLRRRELGAGGPERVQLERPIATLHHVLREARDREGIPLRRVPAVRVCGHALTEAPAQELPHRHAERLSHEVPAGHVEGRQRRLRDLAGPPVLPALDVPGQALHVEGIRPDHVARRQLVDAREQRVRLVDHPHLADAAASVVSHQLDERELAPGGSDDRRDDVDDPHPSLSFSSVRRSLSVCSR